MDRREDFHWELTRVVSHEFLINLNDAAKLNIKLFRIFMRQIEIYHVFTVNAKLLVHTGLFAAGECDYSMHGGNRLGANSLLSAIYGGMVAGPNAVKYVNGLESSAEFSKACHYGGQPLRSPSSTHRALCEEHRHFRFRPYS